MPMSKYEAQARRFLVRFNLRLDVKEGNGKCPVWDAKKCKQGQHEHGQHYEVTLQRLRFKTIMLSETGMCPNGHKDCLSARCYLDKGRPSNLVFDFWGSIHDAEEGKAPSAYDVLACIGGDIQTSEDADEVAEDMGGMKPSQAFACVEWGKKLRAFFTTEEQEAVSEIG